MSQSNAVFIFDFDGVIVDSLTALYSTYLDFLQMYGHKGNKDEFEMLNGPKLADIITYLKNEYNLPPSEDELLLNYLDQLSSLYQRVKLFDGIENVFVFLKERSHEIAIASSGKRKDIMYVLEKFNLSKFIDNLFTGDDVNKAKPSPEIYLLAKSFYPDYEYYVIEDSKNGLEAAYEASTNTIFFNPDKRLNENHVQYEIHDLNEIKYIADEFKLNCLTIAKTSDISLNLVDYQPTFLSTQKQAIEDTWNQHYEKKKLFNGKIICYKSHSKCDNALSVECYISDYKFFFAQLHNSELDLGIMPIGVSGIIIDKNNDVLLGVRQNVTEYNGFYELAPSGGICSSKRKNEVILYEEQLIEELLEETILKKEMIDTINPFCFILDKNNGVYDICSKIHITKTLEMLYTKKNKSEYRDFEILSLKEAKRRINNIDMVPTSMLMLTNI